MPTKTSKEIEKMLNEVKQMIIDAILERMEKANAQEIQFTSGESLVYEEVDDQESVIVSGVCHIMKALVLDNPNDPDDGVNAVLRGEESPLLLAVLKKIERGEFEVIEDLEEV